MTIKIFIRVLKLILRFLFFKSHDLNISKTEKSCDKRQRDNEVRWLQQVVRGRIPGSKTDKPDVLPVKNAREKF